MLVREVEVDACQRIRFIMQEIIFEMIFPHEKWGEKNS
jgi:hypothetical protein